MKRFSSVLVLLAVLAGCQQSAIEPLGRGLVPDAAFHTEARGALQEMQALSFRRNAEVCGYFGYGPEGNFRASDPVVGGLDDCMVESLPASLVVVASYHTHATYDVEADSEVPSSDDIRADMAEQVFGYVATPGGRVWLIDWRIGRAEQMCGKACLRQDPNFIAGDAGPVAHSYTLKELVEREDGV